jgi:uncharacterized membrane protein (TIGR02234 family)
VSRLRPTGKAFVVIVAVLAALVLIAGGRQTWVSGTVNDPVLGASRIAATGTEVAAGLVGVALVAAAAAIASTTSGALMRRVALVLLALAVLAEGYAVLRVLRDPSGLLGGVAAKQAGRTGTVETHASATVWPWLGLAACVLLLLAAVGGLAGASRWQGLGARYETGSTTTGPRGQRVGSDWDRLDEGDDPTVAEDTAPDQPGPDQPSSGETVRDDPGRT